MLLGGVQHNLWPLQQSLTFGISEDASNFQQLVVVGVQPRHFTVNPQEFEHINNSMKIAIVLLTLLAALNCQTDQMVSVLDEKTFLPMTRLRYDGHTYRATNRNWLVMFQVSWCSACKATMPAWIQLSEALSKTMRNGLGSNIRMGIIDW